MPFVNYSAGYAMQSLDMSILESSLYGFGVVASSSTSCLVTNSGGATSLIVNYDSGMVRTSATFPYVIPTGTVTLSDYQHSTLPKKVLIVVDADDGTVKPIAGMPYEPSPYTSTGRLTKLPTPPDFYGTTSYGTLSFGDVVLAEVWLRPSGYYISSGDVTDRRVFVKMPDSNVGFNEADFVMYQVGSNIYGVRGYDGYPITSSTTASVVYSTLVSSLSSGRGLIVDKTGYTGPDTQYNHYFDGLPYAPELCLNNKISNTPYQIISNFDEGTASWNAAPTLSGEDTTASHIRAGSASIFVIATSSTEATRIQLTGSWDLTSQTIYYRAYCGNMSALDQTSIYVCGPEPWYDNYITSWCGVAASQTKSDWVDFEHNMVFGTTTAGSASLASATRIIIDTYCDASFSAVTVSYDQIGTYKKTQPRGIVVLLMDDDDNGTYDYMRPAMDRYGWRGGVCWSSINTNSIGKLRSLSNEGWDILCHGVSHEQWDTMTEEQMNRECIRWLRDASRYKLLKGYRFAAPPYTYFTYENAKVVSKYFHLTRVGPRSSYQNWPFVTDCDICASAMDNVSLSTAEANVDSADTAGMLLIMYWHAVGPSASLWKADTFSAFMDYISTKSVDVLNFTQMAESLPRSSGKIQSSVPSVSS